MSEYDVEKDPDAQLDYGRTWEDWLEDGESLTASSWTVTRGDGRETGDDDLKIMDNAPGGGSATDFSSNGETLVWLEGGQVFTTYNVTNRITTDAGRTDDRTIVIYVKQR